MNSAEERRTSPTPDKLLSLKGTRGRVSFETPGSCATREATTSSAEMVWKRIRPHGNED